MEEKVQSGVDRFCPLCQQKLDFRQVNTKWDWHTEEFRCRNEKYQIEHYYIEFLIHSVIKEIFFEFYQNNTCYDITHILDQNSTEIDVNSKFILLPNILLEIDYQNLHKTIDKINTVLLLQ